MVLRCFLRHDMTIDMSQKFNAKWERLTQPAWNEFVKNLEKNIYDKCGISPSELKGNKMIDREDNKPTPLFIFKDHPDLNEIYKEKESELMKIQGEVERLDSERKIKMQAAQELAQYYNLKMHELLLEKKLLPDDYDDDKDELEATNGVMFITKGKLAASSTREEEVKKMLRSIFNR